MKAAKILNFLLYLVICGLTGTGLLLAWRMPPGSRGGGGRALFGLGRHDWGDIHTYLAYGMIALTIWHLAIHWKWLVKVASKSSRLRLAAGLGVGLAVVGFFLFAPVTQGGGHGHGEGGHGEGGRAQRSE